jgi:GT2 family glycosyltransferase
MTTQLRKPKVTLSVSLVFYDTPLDIYTNTLSSLASAINFAKEKNSLEFALEYSELHLINNNPQAETVFFTTAQQYASLFEKLITYNGHGNIGYGSANNIAIHNSQCTYHLVLNPDVNLSIDALAFGIEHLEKNADVGLVVPHATNQQGDIEYLAKRMPSFLIILLRGLNHTTLNRVFNKRLAFYTYKDKIPSAEPFEIKLASGCFMLCRASALKEAGAFSTQYFLYFEDKEKK